MSADDSSEINSIPLFRRLESQPTTLPILNTKIILVAEGKLTHTHTNGYQLLYFMHGALTEGYAISVLQGGVMSILYSTKFGRKVKYKRGINHREISFSSKRTTKFRVSRSNRPSTGRIWQVILMIMRLAMEVAIKLIGSGKYRKIRFLPESVFYES